MNDPISHLPGIQSEKIRTRRLETQVLLAGPETGEPVLFLHGNLSAGTFWEETMLALAESHRTLAPDQRGFGLSDPTALVDATKGVAEWAEDAIALADHFNWDRFHLVGHSLGGCVAWALIGDHPDRLHSVTLVAPGPPCGFGGTHGLTGRLNHEDGAGSGAGLLPPEFVRKLTEGDREATEHAFSPRTVMNRIYWKPPFRPEREEDFLSVMFQVHMGEKQFPGDSLPSSHWPGCSPGKFGPINAMSPLHNQEVLHRLLHAPEKPPLLWVYGTDDAVVSDNSMSDPGYQGKMGLRPDWPGKEVFPPQPLLSQVHYALDQYEQRSGSVRRLIFSGIGHTPYLERPGEFQSALMELLKSVSV